VKLREVSGSTQDFGPIKSLYFFDDFEVTE
jgi:hypothetical protein